MTGSLGRARIGRESESTEGREVEEDEERSGSSGQSRDRHLRMRLPALLWMGRHSEVLLPYPLEYFTCPTCTSRYPPISPTILWITHGRNHVKSIDRLCHSSKQFEEEGTDGTSERE